MWERQQRGSFCVDRKVNEERYAAWPWHALNVGPQFMRLQQHAEAHVPLLTMKSLEGSLSLTESLSEFRERLRDATDSVQSCGLGKRSGSRELPSTWWSWTLTGCFNHPFLEVALLQARCPLLLVLVAPRPLCRRLIHTEAPPQPSWNNWPAASEVWPNECV